MVCQKWSFRSTGRPGYGIPTLLRLKYDLRHLKILLSTWLMYFPSLDNINYIKLYFYIRAFGPNSSDSETGIDENEYGILQNLIKTVSVMIHMLQNVTQRTPDVVPMLFYCLTAVFNFGPTLKQHWVNASCLLGWQWYWQGVDEDVMHASYWSTVLCHVGPTIN